MQYDVRGNVISVTDALGRVTTTTYDPNQIYPYVVTNPLQQNAGTGYDPGCGALLWQTVPYLTGAPEDQVKSQRAYDNFCRLSKTALPDETINAPHTQVF